MLIRRICSAQRNQVIGDIELSTHTAIVRYRGICELQSGISAQPMIRFFIKSSFVGIYYKSAEIRPDFAS